MFRYYMEQQQRGKECVSERERERGREGASGIVHHIRCTIIESNELEFPWS